MNRRTNLKNWVLISVFLLAMGATATGKIIFVDANAPGANNGSSWTDAYNYLQDGLVDANSEAKPVEIRVAQGIYKPDQSSADPNGTGDRTATFQLINGVTLKGGYAGLGEPDPNARDIDAYESILSGDLDGNDVEVADPHDLHDHPNRAENCYHVVTGSGTDSTAIVDGFSIIGGKADGSYPDYYVGGGMYSNSGSPTVTNCRFTCNSGGGMYNYGSSPTLVNCTFSGNGGTGMNNLFSSPRLTKCVFRGNSGIGMNNNISSATITNCIFTNNSGIRSGGGVSNTTNSSATITNCMFSGNRAAFGGGMANSINSDATLSNCTFSGNWAYSGAGMYNSSSSLTLTNCILWADIPQDIYIDGGTVVTTYSDVQGGWPGEGNIEHDPRFVSLGCWVDANDPNITLEPIDPNAVWIDGDYHLQSQAGRWDPNSESWVLDYVSSPCIDAGNPGCPLGDEPAPNGNRRNMGAYSGTAEASKSPANGRNIADLTNDWAVDYNDLKVFVKYWLETGECIPSDLDRSRSVDFSDYSIYALQWLHKEDSVAIFVDSNTYSNLTSEIQRLKSDIINDLEVNVFIVSGNWSNIKEIKDILIDKYNHKGLIGAIFIGEIPTAYFEYQNSGSNPTDRYFQDLSDKFIDVDGDGKFEREYYMLETDVMMREIWTARIKPPVGHSEGIELLRDYLDRNHNYRTGNITYDEKMLYFGSIAINQDGMSQDDYNDLVNQIDDYTGLYDSDDDVDSIYDPDLEMQKRAYLTALSNSYDFVFVNVHGTARHQWLGEKNPGDQIVVYHYEIKEFRPQALFSVLASCSNGDFTTENYFAGWYLFSGNSLVVKANSTVSFLTGASTMEFLKDYIPLGLGVTFGDMDKNDLSFLVSHILGDPTLTLRPKPTGDLPELSLNRSDIDFGDVARGAQPEQYLSFRNGGTVPLKINYKKACFSINGEYVDLGYWDVFYYYQYPNHNHKFREFEVRPGKSKAIPFVFYPRADGPTGKYTMTILFRTNDPENPYIKINLSGNAI